MTAAALILLAGALTAPAEEQRTLSVYHPKYVGHKMANGEKYNPNALTVAANDQQWPLGTLLKMTCPRTGKSVVAEVTDRMAKRFTGKRVDASQRVWDELTGKRPGLEKVTVTKVGKR